MTIKWFNNLRINLFNKENISYSIFELILYYVITQNSIEIRNNQINSVECDNIY